MISKLALLVGAGATLAACMPGPAPQNIVGTAWAPGQAASGTGHPTGDWVMATPTGPGAPTCDWQQPRELDRLRRVHPGEFIDVEEVLAPGDRVQIDILGDPDGMSGTYVIRSDGRIAVPGLSPLVASGRGERDVQAALRSQLVSEQLFQPLRNTVSVSLIESGGVPVAVTGAVFQAGAVRAGERAPESRVAHAAGSVRGDANGGRTISTAVRAAGGVRPDADVSRIYLIRGETYTELDLSGLVHGWASRDVPVTANDRIIVPSRSCFDPELVRPTPLTQPGIRVFMSNLTRSANNNAGAAIGKDTTSLPYGTRLLQALVAMNCVGGSYMSSDRRAVLMSRNPMSGASIVVERDIEKLVRLADRDAVNPYLMPNDAIACYDSRWTNLKEALGLVSDTVNTATPALILQQAVGQ